MIITSTPPEEAELLFFRLIRFSTYPSNMLILLDK